MFRVFFAALLTLLLTGCIGSIKPTVKPSYYTVDLKNHSICQEDTPTCINLVVITSGTELAGPIEEIYGKKITGPNFRGSLLRMILKPEGAPYTSEKISQNGRFYRVPANQHTNTVWKNLRDIENTIYNDKTIFD